MDAQQFEQPVFMMSLGMKQPLTAHQKFVNPLDIAEPGGSAGGVAATTGIPQLPLWRRLLIRTRFCVTAPICIKVMGEMLGAFLLMFFICGISMSDYIIHGRMNIMNHAIAAALSIMFIIFSLGNISGAHVNPSVTLAFASIGRFPWIQVPWYIIGQFIGSILGTLAARVLYDVHVDLALTIPLVGEFRAFIMEFIIGVEFMFLACAVSNDGQVTGLHASIAVGVAIALNILVAGPISGASMNPNRSLAPAIIVGKYHHLWIYIVAPPLGAVSGAFLYKLSTKEYMRTQH